MRDIAFLGLFLVALALTFNRIPLCIQLWAWVSLLAPNSVLYGIGAGIPYNKVIAGMTLLTLLASREKKSFHGDRTSVLIICFLCLAVLSQFNSDSYQTTGWDILDKFWKIVVLNLLISSFMGSRVRLHMLVLTVCFAVGFVGAGDGLKFLVSGGSYREPGNPAWGDNNHAALIFLMTIPMLAYIREMSVVPLVRLGTLIGIILFVCGVISTSSRGGFVGLIILAIAGILESRHKIRYSLAVIALGAALSQAVSDSWTTRMNTLETAGEDNSFMGRVVAWKMSTLIALHHPLLGGGLHAVQSPNIWNAYLPEFGRLSFIPTDEPTERPRAAHSIYFEVLGDTGFLGLAVFLAIIASSLWTGVQVRLLARGHPDLQWAARLAGKLQLSLVIFLVCGAALSASYNDMNFILFGMLSAVLRIVLVETGRQAAPGGALRPAGGAEFAAEAFAAEAQPRAPSLAPSRTPPLAQRAFGTPRATRLRRDGLSAPDPRQGQAPGPPF